MERHLSVGVTTLIALMAAHRAAAEQHDGSPPALDQQAFKRIEACLRDQDAPAPPTAVP
jgi:hypothetical protein